MSYKDDIRAILAPSERRLFERLNTPQKIQDHLDTVPINFEPGGETYKSPRRVIETNSAHCFEGALLAAAILAYHGNEPFLMDLKTSRIDEDHVIAPFRQHGLWGAISKTNHSILRYRDPLYRSPRELALSYFHEYIHESGKKTMQSYSNPLSLKKYRTADWLIVNTDLHWLVEVVDFVRHFPIAPQKNLRLARKASKLEINALDVTEWPELLD